MLERASARETASRVVLGTVAKAFLKQALGVEIVSPRVSLGAVEAPGRRSGARARRPGARSTPSPVRAFSEAAAAAMVAEVDAASATVTRSAG